MHRIDGPGATVDKKFTEGDPVAGVPATVVTAPWLNDIQEELISVLTAAGITPVKGTQDQLLKALANLLRAQKLTAFTTAGVAPAFTLAPSPAIDAYAANQRFRVKFNASASSGGTLNISGKGAKNLKQLDSNGNKIAAEIISGQLVDVEYDGVDFILLGQTTSAGSTVGIQAACSNLRISATGTNTNISVSADELVLVSSSGTYKTVRNLALSITQTGSLDTGSVTASTWYSIWVIASADDSLVGAITSLSATSPVLPGGYTHKARVGWFRTDGTANKFPLGYAQLGCLATWTVRTGTNVLSPPSIVTGVIGSPNAGNYVAVSTGGVAPPTARSIDVFAFAYLAGASYGVANTNGFNSVGSTNAPPIAYTAPTGSASVDFVKQAFRFVLLEPNLYCAANTSDFVLRSTGWEDNL